MGALMVVLDGASLTINSLAAVAEGRERLLCAARDRMAAAREVVEEAMRQNVPVYGLTTALAERKSVVLDAAGRQGFSRFLIRGHLYRPGTARAALRRKGRDGLPGERLCQGRGRSPA